MAKTESVAEQNSQMPSYTLSEIYANCEAAFGVKPEVIAGAVYGSAKERYTVNEVKDLVEKFKKKEVK